MDIFSHGLWAATAAEAANQKNPKLKLNHWLAAFFGVFPDLFAFTVPFVWIMLNRFNGTIAPGENFRPQDLEPVPNSLRPIFQLSLTLYDYSHSLVIFTLVFVVAWLLLKRPFWEMGGWVLHILSDIPTHSYRFFPTPFLWPISDLKVDGFQWGQGWFIALNYSCLAIVAAVLWSERRKRRAKWT